MDENDRKYLEAIREVRMVLPQLCDQAQARALEQQLAQLLPSGEPPDGLTEAVDRASGVIASCDGPREFINLLLFDMEGKLTEQDARQIHEKMLTSRPRHSTGRCTAGTSPDGIALLPCAACRAPSAAFVDEGHAIALL